MKRYAIVFLLTFFTASLLQAQDRKEKEFSVSPGGTLDLNIEGGARVEIEGWDKNQVSIIAETRRRDWDDFDFEMKKSGDRVIVDLYEVDQYRRDRRYRGNSSGELRFEIKVPKKFDLRVDVTAGDLKLTGIEGEIRGQLVAGDVDIRNLKGEIDFSTTAGNFRVDDSQLEGRLKTVAGDISIRDNDGDLRTSTLFDEITQSINVDVIRDVTRNIGRDINRSVRRDVRSGNRSRYNYNYNYSPRRRDHGRGRIVMRNADGPVHIDHAWDGTDVTTEYGDITIAYADGNISAETEDGNIEVEELEGWINALTYRGDINVNIVDEPRSGRRRIVLESLKGDVELTVPKDYEMDIDIELEYSKDSSGNFKIESDFNLSREDITDWQRPSRSSTRGDRAKWDSNDEIKRITSTGKTGSGKNKVIIKAANGNVKLRKGN